jgi:histidinol-phosphatase (PHP family)
MKLLNLHNHTPLCGHATGSVDDYVEAAIKNGAGHMGFSDHAPLPPGLRENVTMSPRQTEGYISMLESARKKYRGRIEILIRRRGGFPLHEISSSADPTFSMSALNYLIGSCHFSSTAGPSTMRANIDEFSRRDINDIYNR